MAQDITWLGNEYSNVPFIELPKTGSGFARFDDCSIVTASAADVLSGKIFVASDGTITTGTGSGGSTPTMKLSVIRPDAELIQSWTFDKLLVDDEVGTLPAYSTSAKAIITGGDLSPTITTDRNAYNYYVCMRGLAIPVYNTTTKVKGRCDYGASFYNWELVDIPANEIETVDGSKVYASRNSVVTSLGSAGRELYWTGASAITIANNVTYGTYVTGQAPTLSSGVITCKAPIFGIRGSTTQMTSTAWGQMTDIRYQYVIEVWKVPVDHGAKGWQLNSSIRHVIDCARGTGHKLT